MAPHHHSARVWAIAALVAVVLLPSVKVGWWLPLHLALVGATSQLIVGGQLQFSSALTMARPVSRRPVVVRLLLLNVAAAAIVIGRVADITPLTMAGGVLFACACLWAAWAVERLWRQAISRRFAVTRLFYGAANLSIVAGAVLGAILAAGEIHSGDTYVSLRLAHIGLNLIGWGGLTILGTVITFLPTVLHVRIPEARGANAVPLLAFCGLTTIATGLMVQSRVAAVAGGVVLALAFALFGHFVSRIVRAARPRPVPVAARHIIAGLAWLGCVSLIQIPLLARDDAAAIRDLWVVGIAGGFVLQVVLGSWAFLLPMSRGSGGEATGRELIAFELGARPQVAAYNVGLIVVLLALRGFIPDPAGTAGIALTWAASAWVMFKTLWFPRLAALPSVRAKAERWWAPRSHDTPEIRTVVDARAAAPSHRGGTTS